MKRNVKQDGSLLLGLAAACLILLCAVSLIGTADSTADSWYQDEGENAAAEAPPPLSLDEIPEHTGEPYVAVNGNVPYFSAEDLTTQSFERYSPLDSLGRCGTAYANISRETMPTEQRGAIGEIRPCGWHTVRYDDLIDGRYLYNRCHLIAYRLAGENANVRNLITGTRYLNTVGMLPFEDRVGDYVEATGNHVLYRVTPIYEGENLLASGVLMEAYSVEDGGAGVRFSVFCYNVQPGIAIDYATGDSQRVKPADESPETNTGNVPADAVYILNRNTKKFHYADCSSVSDMSEKNKLPSSADREAILAWGYVPCKRCKP